MLEIHACNPSRYAKVKDKGMGPLDTNGGRSGMSVRISKTGSFSVTLGHFAFQFSLEFLHYGLYGTFRKV